MKRLTVDQFHARFPDDNACLDHLFKLKYGQQQDCENCGHDFHYKRVKGRRSYQCDFCAFQVYPTAGTVFHKTTTPLKYWFTAIYMFTITRNGVAAKELERTLHVCYKTALRMAHQIKKLMFENQAHRLMGEVMVDETYLAGKVTNLHKKDRETTYKKHSRKDPATIVTLMEKNGNIISKVWKIETPEDMLISDIVKDNVHPSSTLVTDGSYLYHNMKKSFKKHVRIYHNRDQYTKDGFTTNNVENYFSTLKRMIKGTHIHVSHKHLPKYVAENTFRYVHRHEPEKMFDLILSRVF